METHTWKQVVQRQHYLAFMEWFVYTLPEVALPVKVYLVAAVRVYGWILRCSELEY